MLQQVTIQVQPLVCDTKAEVGILVGGDAMDKLGCYTITNVYTKQLTIPLVLKKVIQIPPDKTTPITLLPKYTSTSYHTQLDF